MKKTIKTILIITISYAIFNVLWRYFLSDLRETIDQVINNLTVSYLVSFFIIGIPIYIGIFLTNKNSNFFENLGLSKKGITTGILFGFICTLPMLIGYASTNPFNQDITFYKIIRWIVFAAFMEEVVYRAFLFGQIYRNTNLGFVLSLLIGSTLFALTHIYQSNDLVTLIGILLTTFVASVLFSWIYVEWNFNLWTSIFLHLFMNAAWILFPALQNTNALGGVTSNIFRILSLSLVIGLTVYYKKQKGQKFKVNRHTIWIKK